MSKMEFEQPYYEYDEALGKIIDLRTGNPIDVFSRIFEEMNGCLHDSPVTYDALMKHWKDGEPT